MVGSTASEARTLGLLSQNGAQAPPNELIQPFKGEGARA
jgi:hypothetical protein